MAALGKKVLAAALLASACAPDSPPEFAGEYDVERAQWTCRRDDPEAAVWSESAYYGEPIEIVDDDSGHLAVPLPMPPCAIIGIVESDQLRLMAEDCVETLDATEDIEAQTVRYSGGFGRGAWKDGKLELATQTTRRYTSVPEGLPDWWDASGACSAVFTLTRHEDASTG